MVTANSGKAAVDDVTKQLDKLSKPFFGGGGGEFSLEFIFENWCGAFLWDFFCAAYILQK